MKKTHREMDTPAWKEETDFGTSNNIRSPRISQTRALTSFPEPAGSNSPTSATDFPDPRSSDGSVVASDKIAKKERSNKSANEACQIVKKDIIVTDGNTKQRQKPYSPQKDKCKDNKTGNYSADGTVVPEKPELLSIPQTNFAIGLLVMCCFNPLFGLFALYFSLRAASAYRDGDNRRGSLCARMSIVVSLLGIMLTMIIISTVVLYLAVYKHSTKRGMRQLSSASLGF